MTSRKNDKIRWKKTHCARMDHGGCALLVGLRGERIVKVKGDPEGWLNAGWICPKALASPGRLTHPDRLKSPLQRVGERGEGRWRKISWPEAIRTIAERLGRIREEHGARAAAFCQGMPKGLEHFVLIRLANLFGSPNVVTSQDVCHAPREVSGVHTCGFYPVADFHHESKLVTLWGSNATSTNEEGEICSLLLKQWSHGVDLMVVDPIKTELAEKARLWLQVKPGADHALALSFLNVIIEENLYDAEFVEKWTHGFDELAAHVKQYTPEKMADVTGVAADLVRTAAAEYANSRPGVIQWGNPIEQNIHTFDTVRALVCLMAICGNLDVPGGNIQANEPKILGLGKFVRADQLPAKRKEIINAHHGTIPRMMTVPPSFFRKAVLEEIPYPVKGAYIQCANPLLSYADGGWTLETMKKLDFIAVADIFMTPTAAMADIVLPAATHFEFNDIGHYGLGHGCILARPKIVEPPGECRPDMEILNELGKAMTPPEYWHESYEGFLEELLAPSGLDWEGFVRQGVLKGEERFSKHLSAGFRTPTGKVELALSTADKFKLPALPRFQGLPEEEDPDRPFTLTSAKDRFYLHSSYRWVAKLRRARPDPVVRIHPEAAKPLGVEENDEVIIETRFGSITQFAHLTEKIHPSVICAAYGWWLPEGDPGSLYEWEKHNYNILTSAEKLGKEFGTPNLKGVRCSIRKKENSTANERQ